MRHRHGQRKLNITDSAHRIELLRSLGNALIKYETIKTTLPRAKELRRFIEPLVNMGKNPTVAGRRLVFSRLQNRSSVVKVFNDLGVRIKDRSGGYTRILKCGFRAGDSAPMAMVELVDKADTTTAITPKVDDTTAAAPKADAPTKADSNKTDSPPAAE